jgi:hypothetical protein
MRKTMLLLAAVAALPALTGAAQAREYPWCARYGGWMSSTRNCGFDTFGQCMATISGVGGVCERNMMAGPPPRAMRRKKRD